ncbi:hypothetical protein AB0J30_13995 [Streptomyces microflavus]|uniref:DUF6907 domain-containing protein n=1 Tax=Streptomyces microflavus TaxID=1919 RepID=UPI00342D7145
MRNAARTTTVPATFRQSGAPVTPPAAPDPLETTLRSAFDQGEPVDADVTPTVESTPAELYALWQGMTIGETAATPLPKLLTLLGVRLEEVDPGDLSRGIAARFYGRIGDAEIMVSRTLPQADREPIVRSFLSCIGPDLKAMTERDPHAPVFREARVKIECHEWCTENHDEAVHVDDIQHTSAEAHLELPQPGRLSVPVLHSYISLEPYSRDAAKRVPHLVVTDENEYFHPSLPESLGFADSLVAFADNVRTMAHRAAQQPGSSTPPATPVAEPGHFPWCDTDACITTHYDERDGGGSYIEHVGQTYNMPLPDGMEAEHGQVLNFRLGANEAFVDDRPQVSFLSHGEGVLLDEDGADLAIANLEAALSALRAMRTQMVQGKQA